MVQGGKPTFCDEILNALGRTFRKSKWKGSSRGSGLRKIFQFSSNSMICCWPPPQPLVASIPVGQGPSPPAGSKPGPATELPRMFQSCCRGPGCPAPSSEAPAGRAPPHSAPPHSRMELGLVFQSGSGANLGVQSAQRALRQEESWCCVKGSRSLSLDFELIEMTQKEKSLFSANSYQFKIAVLVLSSLLHGPTGVQCNH